jgi:hypothetical protein
MDRLLYKRIYEAFERCKRQQINDKQKLPLQVSFSLGLDRLCSTVGKVLMLYVAGPGMQWKDVNLKAKTMQQFATLFCCVHCNRWSPKHLRLTTPEFDTIHF